MATETLIRLGFALGIFIVIASWEVLSPRRKQQANRKQRWTINLGLAIVNSVLMRVTVGVLVYLTALNVQTINIGVIQQITMPSGLAFALSLLLLDFAIYIQHLAMHRWRWLWRLHQVHHSDLVFDASTAVRFHPLEILLSLCYKMLCIVIIGANADAVLAFEILLNGVATFNHGNIKLPITLDKFMRWFIVTPDMHRIHHSIEPAEFNRNYGFCLAWWDRILGTYQAEPKQAQTTMTIGLKPYRNLQDLGFITLVCLPFKKLRRS